MEERGGGREERCNTCPRLTCHKSQGRRPCRQRTRVPSSNSVTTTGTGQLYHLSYGQARLSGGVGGEKERAREKSPVSPSWSMGSICHV